jgi:Fe-S oxidoreductase
MIPGRPKEANDWLKSAELSNRTVEKTIYRFVLLIKKGQDYGYKYKNFGGIGVIHTAFQKGLKEAARAGLFVCTACKGYVDKCPGRIDTPGMILRLRRRAIEEGIKPSIYDATTKSIERTGNVFGLSPEQRLDWVEEGEPTS